MTAKTLKDFLEVYKPKSPDEQKFVDKHVTIKHKDRNGNGDDVFKATNIKTVERKKERHGYDVGEDEKVYEEVDIDALLDEALNVLLSIDEKTLTPAEMRKREEVVKAIKRTDPKMDKSMAYAIATKTAKRVAEEAEELEELSQKTVRAYRDKARDDKESAEDDREYYKAHDDNTDDEDMKIRKRTAGIKTATKKMYGGAKVPVKENVNLDELSSDTVKSYMGKAMGDAVQKTQAQQKKKYASDIKADQKGIDKRVRGLTMAKKKMANEEVEVIDEISVDMAHRYLKGKRERDYDISPDGTSSKLKKPQSFDKMNKDAKSSMRALRTIEKSKKANEEVEAIDELSKDTLSNYADKASDARGHRNLSTKKVDNRYAGVKKASDKLTKEEVEAIDEISKATMGRYINKAKDSIDMTSYRSGIKDGTAISRNDPYTPKNPLEKKLSKRHKGIETAVKKLTKEEIVNRTVEKYMPELADWTPMSKDEKLVARLENKLSEGHIHTLLALFNSLNEDNQNKMMQTCTTDEGINSLLDFAIKNRGE